MAITLDLIRFYHYMGNSMLNKPSVAIIGAGPAGLMTAEVLSASNQYDVHVFEQMPSAARKFLMAGKTGLNISHAEALTAFIRRYDQPQWLEPWLQRCDAPWIQAWMKTLGVESYIGSSGRIFPVEMKAAPLLRAWLARLGHAGVQFHYRHQCIGIQNLQLYVKNKAEVEHSYTFDAIVLACGAVSWPRLGSDGAWQQWLSPSELKPFQASNVGVTRPWSEFMQPFFGHPLKRITAWTAEANTEMITGDVVITHYGLESGVIYRLNRYLRVVNQPKVLYVDLLPSLTEAELITKLQAKNKQSIANVWRKVGLDSVKSGLLRELVTKSDWSSAEKMAKHIKALAIPLDGFRPIDEAISCAGGVLSDALTEHLQLKSHQGVFCCGEMLDWDAPTGGYLLTACFASGRVAGEGVIQFLTQSNALNSN